MKFRRALLRSCARCGVESAHGPTRKDCNRRRLPMSYFAPALSQDGLAVASKLKTHKKPLGISLLRASRFTRRTTSKGKLPKHGRKLRIAIGEKVGSTKHGSCCLNRWNDCRIQAKRERGHFSKWQT